MMSVKVIGLEELHGKITDGIPQGVKRGTFKLRGSALKKAKEEAKPHAGDTGALATTIKASVALTAAIPFKLRVFTNAPIAAEVEEGRKGGGRRPSRQAVRNWAKRHGIDAGNRNVSVLLKAIARRTKGVRFMEKAGEETLATYIPDFIVQAERDVKAEWDK